MEYKLTAAAQCVSLSGKATDKVMELLHMFKSYVVLQRLISPSYADEAQDNVPASREEMDALLETLNAEVQRRGVDIIDTMTEMGAQARLSQASLSPPAAS